MSDDSIFQQIVPVSDQFRDAYGRGDDPNLSEYLDRVEPEYQGWLLEDLIRIEHRFHKETFAERRQQYLDRFPQFEHEIDVVYRELAVASPLPVESQETIGIDETLGHRESEPKLGKYRLLQKIGRGGMGSVWMAEQQEPVVRRVALKVIRDEFQSKEVIARFEAERQALALNGTSQHCAAFWTQVRRMIVVRPYFVMELVRGIPITEYCDQVKATTLAGGATRSCFRPVCDAVQHAHQKVESFTATSNPPTSW